MIKNLKYAIMAIVFIGLAKILQVTTFDADRYKKTKESSFVKKNTPKNSEKKIAKETEEPSGKESTQTQTTSADGSQEAADNTTKTEANEPRENPKSTRADQVTLSSLKNEYLALKLAELPPGHLREDIVIRYYRHEKDGEKVYSLKKLGYYIHEKEATETVGLGSNVLYYGKNVNLEDIQIVALTLINSGLPLKDIQQTQYDWKINAIEIGTNTQLLNSSNLSASDVQNFRK